MIVRITRAKVGHCQAPSKQNGPQKRAVLFGTYLVEANLRSKLRPAGPAGAKGLICQAPSKQNGPRQRAVLFGTYSVAIEKST